MPKASDIRPASRKAESPIPPAPHFTGVVNSLFRKPLTISPNGPSAHKQDHCWHFSPLPPRCPGDTSDAQSVQLFCPSLSYCCSQATLSSPKTWDPSQRDPMHSPVPYVNPLNFLMQQPLAAGRDFSFDFPGRPSQDNEPDTLCRVHAASRPVVCQKVCVCCIASGSPSRSRDNHPASISLLAFAIVNLVDSRITRLDR